MANRSRLIISLLFIGSLLIPKADAGIISNFVSGIEYFLQSFTSIVKEIFNPPRNSNSSIQYRLFTPESPNEPCYLEQNTESLERCPFNSAYPLKFLIHGFLVTKPYIWKLKDRMLKLYEYNIIEMDWTRYNQPPYILAAINTQLVGYELANFIQFLNTSKGVDSKNVHLIGHSLGAHLSGVAGKELSTDANLGRISGMDPAYPLFSRVSVLHRLTYTDADFVDVIHTSVSTLGFGIKDPIGHQDFYPNGGSEQPECTANRTSEHYGELEAEYVGTIDIDVNVCDHSSATLFFFESIDPAVCVFVAAMCDSYEDFESGRCSRNNTDLLTKMGLPAAPALGLGPTTEFYLRTGASPPYCLADGYEAE